MDAGVVVLFAALRTARWLLDLLLTALEFPAEELGGDVREALLDILVSLCSSHRLDALCVGFFNATHLLRDHR